MFFDVNDATLGLTGGLMIGVAAAMFLLCLGRIAGISGILGTTLRGGVQCAENLAFLVGLAGAPALIAVLTGPIDITIGASPAVLVIAGLLVGVGTRMGSGCTSGHGVCGMTRFSQRSVVSVAVFMLVAGIVASAMGTLAGG